MARQLDLDTAEVLVFDEMGKAMSAFRDLGYLPRDSKVCIAIRMPSGRAVFFPNPDPELNRICEATAGNLPFGGAAMVADPKTIGDARLLIHSQMARQHRLAEFVTMDAE